MKLIKNILMVSGLLSQVGVSLADGQSILDRIEKEKSEPIPSYWENNGPTREDILAATKVENLAAKESKEDALINAVKNGDLKNVETLIADGTDLEARDSDNMTPLMLAAKKGHTDIASRLIDAGAHVDATDRFNWTAIFHAVDEGHAAMVKLLITNGAATDQKIFAELFMSALFKGQLHPDVLGSRIEQEPLKSVYEDYRKLVLGTKNK